MLAYDSNNASTDANAQLSKMPLAAKVVPASRESPFILSARKAWLAKMARMTGYKQMSIT
jgi:hypothetical protein